MLAPSLHARRNSVLPARADFSSHDGKSSLVEISFLRLSPLLFPARKFRSRTINFTRRFLRSKSSRTPSNVFILNLAVFDLPMATEMPMLVINSFRWSGRSVGKPDATFMLYWARSPEWDKRSPTRRSPSIDTGRSCLGFDDFCRHSSTSLPKSKNRITKSNEPSNGLDDSYVIEQSPMIRTERRVCFD